MVEEYGGLGSGGEMCTEVGTFGDLGLVKRFTAVRTPDPSWQVRTHDRCRIVRCYIERVMSAQVVPQQSPSVVGIARHGPSPNSLQARPPVSLVPEHDPIIQ
jgi:hypothetical protein